MKNKNRVEKLFNKVNADKITVLMEGGKDLLLEQDELLAALVISMKVAAGGEVEPDDLKRLAKFKKAKPGQDKAIDLISDRAKNMIDTQATQ